MQEFSSISVSSYEAGNLAGRLTEQSSEGWSVVAIVPTGSTVTAYLSRQASADSGPSEHVPEQVPVDEIAADEIAVAEAAVIDATETAVADPEGGVESAIDEIAPEAAESAGWAASAAESGDVVEQVSAPSPEVSAAVADVAVQTETAAATEVVAEAAAASAAPAGWYADPSSRFELRYWDGSQWTEHVSRAGQQYTDPPVA
jgi:hypothetical protein